jgi:hypothetical protein
MRRARRAASPSGAVEQPESAKRPPRRSAAPRQRLPLATTSTARSRQVPSNQHSEGRRPPVPPFLYTPPVIPASRILECTRTLTLDDAAPRPNIGLVAFRLLLPVLQGMRRAVEGASEQSDSPPRGEA